MLTFIYQKYECALCILCLRLLDYVLEGSIELGQNNNVGHMEEVHKF